ncbi:MAG: type II toxin-antitoxin system VapC family toxin [Acidobacteriota bacterium]|nr:type II toxin-antitoxin system VapC family toxin [Acidobacteriota bacterium]
MSGFLIDTNIISEFVKPDPNSFVKLWFETVDTDSLFASVITFGEIRLGIENLPSSKRRKDLEQWLSEGLPQWFESNLLPVTKAIADRWGRVTMEAKRKGTALAMADGLIAATALVHDLAIVTRNLKDFAGLGVLVVNPWEASNS